MRPHSFFENVAVPAPDTCTHLTGADHVASLTAALGSLTAIANDYPADELFARQVEAHGRAGDVLMLLSTSGRSPNAVAAARRARDCGITVLALTGPAANPLAAVADDAVCIDSPWTATVQECHLVALHLVCAAFDSAVLAEPARVAR